MNISNFFPNILGAELINSRWSWGAENPNTKQLFLRVWEDHIETVDDTERCLILKTDWTGNSLGFPERKRHILALRKGAEGYGVVCTAKNVHIASRKIADFNRDTLLILGKVIDDGTSVYAHIIGRISVNELARPHTSAESIVSDLKLIFEHHPDVTQRETLANARVGQGRFRTQVLKMWDMRCCVTGSTTLDAIRASHIKPWRDSNNVERLDPNNGLSLIATLDALFDAGLVTFALDGKMLVSSKIDDSEKHLLGLSGLRLARMPGKRTSEYLAYHRKEIFVDNK